MPKYAVHRCRLFDYLPSAIQCMASHEIQSPNSDTTIHELAVGREDGEIQIIHSSPKGFYNVMTIPGSSRKLEDLTWSDGRLFSAELQGDITEYDLTSGMAKYSTDSYGGAVWCLATGKNSLIAAGCEDGSIKIFDCSESQLTFTKSLDRQEGRILTCAFHPNNEVLASGSVDVIRIWSFKSGHAIQRIRLESGRNSDTIVWAVKFLSDHTIVSGDSKGKVQFWNGKNATLIKSFHSHQADILSLCVSKDESSVYASGVDTRVMEINYLRVEEDETPMDQSNDAFPKAHFTGEWVKGATLQKHTHDVRALAIVGNLLASGGVDTNILLRSVIDRADRRVRKVVSFPHTSRVHFASNAQIILFQYPNHLDLWKLGIPDSTNDDVGKDVVLEKQPTKILQLKCPSQSFEHITCSSISPCGHWVAYSTVSSFRLFRLNWQDPCDISVVKVRVVWFKPALAISFSSDSSHMVTSSRDGKIFLIKLDANTHVHIAHIFKGEEKLPFRLLATSPCNRYIAASDIRTKVRVYDTQNHELRCTLPVLADIPSAIAFKPSNTVLVVAYQSHEVVEYDVTAKSYTKWYRDAHSVGMNVLRYQRTFRGKRAFSAWNSSPIITISFAVESPNVMVLASQKAVYFIDQSQDIRKENQETTEQNEHQTKAVKCASNFQPLLFAGIFDHGSSMLVVERSLSEIYDNLPPTLYQKKFGT